MREYPLPACTYSSPPKSPLMAGRDRQVSYSGSFRHTLSPLTILLSSANLNPTPVLLPPRSRATQSLSTCSGTLVSRIPSNI